MCENHIKVKKPVSLQSTVGWCYCAHWSVSVKIWRTAKCGSTLIEWILTVAHARVVVQCCLRISLRVEAAVCYIVGY